MIHQFIFAGPKPGLDVSAFHSYWVHFHAVEYAAKIPQICQYLVATRVDGMQARTMPFFAGVAEIWLADEQSQLASLQSVEFLEGARRDEPRWAAFWQTLALDTDPHLVKPHRSESDLPAFVKLYVLFKRRDGQSLADFRRKLLDEHPKTVLHLPALERYQICLVRDNAYSIGEPRFDALEVLSFEAGQDSRAILADPHFGAIEASWLSLAQPHYLFTLMAKEHWIIRPGEKRCETVELSKKVDAAIDSVEQIQEETNMPEDMTRRVAEQWFNALKQGDGRAALACLDQNVHWINNPGQKGLSDIIPWLGDFHGLAAVQESFVIWGGLAQVQSFELLKLVIDGDEALAVVHEVATVKATGMNYDIEFIQRLRVANEKIVEWKSYWDTVKGIIPFRGDTKARLIAAAQTGNHDEAMLVLPYGADPNTVDDATGQTVLMIAAGRGHLEVVQALLDSGAAPNMLDARAGASALHKACQGGHLNVVQALVAGGALIDVQCVCTGHTPLVEAIWFKHPEIVRFLVDRGAGLKIDTHYGFTLRQHIDYALRVNASVPAELDKLRSAEAAVNDRQQRDGAQVQAQQLMAAVQAGDLGRTRELLGQHVAIDERSPILNGFNDGHTPLLVACRDGHTEIVAALLEAGADANAVEPTFLAVPLHKAVYNGHDQITEMLVRRPGIKLDFQGATNGYSPLLDALWHGFEACASSLLNAGARVDVCGHDGQTPLSLARDVFGADHALTRAIAALAASGKPAK